MQMPGRTFSSSSYRYGFNGKENDNTGDNRTLEQDFGARMYSGRLGRFFSLDPMMKKYPNESNYSFVSNSPLIFKDADGRDKVVSITIVDKLGKSTTIQIKDTKSFVYSYGSGESMAWNETIVRYKQDEYIKLTIDLSNPLNNHYDYNLGPKTKTQFLDGVRANIFGEPLSLENEDERYGFRIFGSETKGSSEWVKGLPKAAAGSQSLDLGLMLDVANSMRNSQKAFDLAEDISCRFGKILPGYVKYYNLLQASMDIHDNLEKASGGKDPNLLETEYRPTKLKVWSLPPGSDGRVAIDDSSAAAAMWDAYQKKHPGNTLKQKTKTINYGLPVLPGH